MNSLSDRTFFPIEGIAIVVANTRGHQLVFHSPSAQHRESHTPIHKPSTLTLQDSIAPASSDKGTQSIHSSYPSPSPSPSPSASVSASASSLVSNQVVSIPTGAGSNSFLSSTVTSGLNPASTTGSAPSVSSRTRAAPSADHTFGLPPDLFASLLCPKSALCNQLFEVSVDQQLFVGFPVLLEGSAGSQSQTSSQSQLQIQSQSQNLSQSQSQSQLQSQSQSQSFTSPSSGFQSLSQSNLPNSQSGALSVKSSSEETITCYTVVAVLPSAVATEHPALLHMYRKVVARIASALQYEQARTRYVTDQIQLLVSLRDSDGAQMHPAYANATAVNSHRHDYAAQLQASAVDMNDPHQLAIRKSRLAAELESVYLSLRERRAVHLFVNGWIEISISLRPKQDHPSFPIRPYQTLVLTTNESKILESLPDDCSPGLIKLIQSCNPRKAFQELQLELEIPLSQLFRYAAHLVYWKFAIVTDTLTRHNIYVLSKNVPDEAKLEELSTEFSRVTKAHTLTEILHRFSHPRLLGDHFQFMNQELGREFIHIVIFLLKHNLLTQLHTYIHLILDEQEVLKELRVYGFEMRGSHLAMGMVRESIGDGDLPAAPSKLREFEERYIESIMDNSAEAKLLKRLCPYFRGRHHLEEIMWRETITRNDIALVLSKYRNILVCAMHE